VGRRGVVVRISGIGYVRISGIRASGPASLGGAQIVTGSSPESTEVRTCPQAPRVESRPEDICDLRDLLVHGLAQACIAAHRDTYARLMAFGSLLARRIDSHGSAKNDHLQGWYIDCSLQLPDGGHGNTGAHCTHRGAYLPPIEGAPGKRQCPRRHRGGRTRAR
jgi:hypothetical protein